MLGQVYDERLASLGIQTTSISGEEMSERGRETATVVVTDANDQDLDRVQEIYAHYVRHSLATFEEVPPTVDDMRKRHAAITGIGLPFLVATIDGRVVGYSYASGYRPRPAYRFTVENSVYVADGLRGRGVGSALLRSLIQRCGDGQWRQMIAIIGDSDNAASMALHRRCGFRTVGTLTAVGFKLGRWVDTTVMQLSLKA